MRVLVTLSIFVAAVLMTAVIIEAACGLRCPTDSGSVLVCDGDSKFDTISKCGDPDYVEDVGFASTGRFGSVTNSTGRYGSITNSTSTRGDYQEFSARVEKWYYNCGEDRFIKIVTFKGNEVVLIESEDYGAGPQKCW